MSMGKNIQVLEEAAMRDKVGVFADRRHAGQVLAKMLADYEQGGALVRPHPLPPIHGDPLTVEG